MFSLMLTVRFVWLAYRRGMRIASRFDIELKEFLRASFVDPYRVRLLVQAEHLYRNSDLYQVRLRERGYMPAIEGFHGGVAAYFFAKARKAHWSIRLRLLRDAILDRAPQAYDTHGKGVS